MNLRILKKLSKRAAPLLLELGEKRAIFPSDCEGYNGITGHDFKHFERSKAYYPFEMDLKYMPRHGKHWIVLRNPSHTLNKTMMVGWMSGYYDPEWEERTAWEILRDTVHDHFAMIKWNNSDDDPEFIMMRNLNTPQRIFQAVREIIKAAANKPSKNVVFALESDDFEEDDFEEDGPYPGEECGRWRNGRLDQYCMKAGSEECDFECPYSR